MLSWGRWSASRRIQDECTYHKPAVESYVGWRCREPDASGTLTLGSGRFCFSGERLRWSGGSIACAHRHSRTFSVASNALRLGLSDRCRFPAVGSTSTKFMTVFQPLNCRHFATALFISDVMSISGRYRKPPRSSAKSGITVNLSSIDSRGRKTPAKPHSTQSALQ